MRSAALALWCFVGYRRGADGGMMASCCVLLPSCGGHAEELYSRRRNRRENALQRRSTCIFFGEAAKPNANGRPDEARDESGNAPRKPLAEVQSFGPAALEDLRGAGAVLGLSPRIVLAEAWKLRRERLREMRLAPTPLDAPLEAGGRRHRLRCLRRALGGQRQRQRRRLEHCEDRVREQRQLRRAREDVARFVTGGLAREPLRAKDDVGQARGGPLRVQKRRVRYQRRPEVQGCREPSALAGGTAVIRVAIARRFPQLAMVHNDSPMLRPQDPLDIEMEAAVPRQPGDCRARVLSDRLDACRSGIRGNFLSGNARQPGFPGRRRLRGRAVHEAGGCQRSRRGLSYAALTERPSARERERVS